MASSPPFVPFSAGAVDEYPMPPLAPLCACCKILRNHLQIAYGQLQEVRRRRALDLELHAAAAEKAAEDFDLALAKCPPG